MEGDLTEGFLHYEFGGLSGGAYFRNFTVSNVGHRRPRPAGLGCRITGLVSTVRMLYILGVEGNSYAPWELFGTEFQGACYGRLIRF